LLAKNEIARAINARRLQPRLRDQQSPGHPRTHQPRRRRILWYLGLLVPFVFFAEKLVFGFADIRKQLLAVSLIFVVVFALLNLFHPAFQMCARR